MSRAWERGFDATEDPAIDALAERLEGVPLALELAAGRLGVLAPGEVLGRLGLRLLRSGRTDVADRQTTLSATLDWSWEQLLAAERAVFAQLSVFDGGWPAGAAERVVAVPAGAPPVAGLVRVLVDRSLVQWTGERFHLFQSVREYAATQLETEGAFPGSGPAARDEVEQRHGRWVADLASAEVVDSVDADGGTLRRRLAPEVANAVAAGERAARRGDATVATGALTVAFLGVELGGRHAGIVDLATAVSKLSLDDRERASTLRILGIALKSVDRARARGVLDAAVSAARATGDPRLMFSALVSAARLHLEGSRLSELSACAAEATELARLIDAPQHRAVAHLLTGNLRVETRDPVGGITFLEAALADFRSVGNLRGVARVLHNLGVCSLRCGRAAEGLGRLREALEVGRAVGDRQFEADALDGLTAALGLAGDLSGALAAAEQSVALAKANGDTRTEARAAGNLARVLASLGSAGWESAFERALALLHRAGLWRSLGSALRDWGESLRKAGRAEAAAALAQQGSGLPTVSDEQRAWELAARADLAVAAGAPGLAGRLAAELASVPLSDPLRASVTAFRRA